VTEADRAGSRSLGWRRGRAGRSEARKRIGAGREAGRRMGSERSSACVRKADVKGIVGERSSSLLVVGCVAMEERGRTLSLRIFHITPPTITDLCKSTCTFLFRRQA
jgi:hypothetical protein